MRLSTATRCKRNRNRFTAIEPLEQRQLLSSVVVNTTADSTDAKGSSTVSLRDAIAIANAATSATAITFSPTVFDATKTITLGGTELELSNTKEATTITGPAAALTISGNGKSRILEVDSAVTVSLTDLAVTKGASERGGAILSEGTLTGTGLFLYGNTTSGDADQSDGGAISAAGTLRLVDSTISGNTASSSGGGVDMVGTSATLIDDTITNNTSEAQDSGKGGGISFYSGTLNLDDVTISGNSASGGGGGIGYTRGGGIAKIADSIIAGNISSNGADVYGTISSLGHNLIGKTDGSTGWISSDYTGTVAKPLNAELGSLANNGGPTETILPLAGSPAIDKGSNSLIPSGVTTDQRGLPRIYNSTVDIGAVEVQPVITLTAPASQTATVGTSRSVTLGSFTALDATAPFKDTITWGDGTANTVVAISSAGTIPATAHVFAKSGTITVTEIVTDAKGDKSNTVTFTETVTASLGSITGTVFNDGNGDGKLDDHELGIGGYTVFIDLKGTGTYAAGDPTAVSTLNGSFSFTGLAAGTYKITVEPVTGVTNSTPKVLTITLSAGGLSSGNLFGEEAI